MNIKTKNDHDRHVMRIEGAKCHTFKCHDKESEEHMTANLSRDQKAKALGSKDKMRISHAVSTD